MTSRMGVRTHALPPDRNSAATTFGVSRRSERRDRRDIARLKVDIEMSQPTVDHQSARRRTAMWMFIVLVLGVLGLVISLIFAVPALPDSEFVRGIVLTAIAGAISAFLSFISIIVKGLVDNLTREE